MRTPEADAGRSVLVGFLELGRSVQVAAGTTLLAAARQAGVVIESPCNGAGCCGKCTVAVDAASLANLLQKGRPALPAPHTAPGLVLACEAEILGDVSVTSIPLPEDSTLQMVGHGVEDGVVHDPHLAKEFDEARGVTRVVVGGALLCEEPGDTRSELYGAVLDIGTTTLAASLVRLDSGATLATGGALNPQSRHAQDVLSRIRYAASAQGLATMHAAVVEEISRLILALTADAGVSPENVYETVLSGNSCMLYLALKEDPAPLGRYPYPLRLTGDEERSAAALGLPLNRCGLLYLPPLISAYVGADITAGILATGLAASRGVTLLVDVGTNGEMVLNNRGRLLATSTAAGPALEGMNISCGMRATCGAIDSCAIDVDGNLSYSTIAGGEAVGICGSGLIDLVAALVERNVVAASGRFRVREAETLPGPLRERVETVEGRTVFRLSERVTLSQKDVRQVQLAKGAIRAGIESLVRHAGVAAGAVERVLIAGSFGYHLNPASLLKIGLLPQEFAGRIEFVGNTSLSGGKLFLVSRSAQREMAETVRGVEVLELANQHNFDACFVKCLAFPEASAPSVREAP